MMILRLRRPLLLAVITVSMAGCSSDPYVEEIEEPEQKHLEWPTYRIPKDSLVGKWELVREGIWSWYGDKTTVVFNDDGTVVYTEGDKVQYGTYAFPSENCDRILGAYVFVITSTVKMLNHEIWSDCYLWPDSARFYDNNMQYFVDHSHLYVRIKEQ